MYIDVFWMTLISVIVSYFLLSNVMLTFKHGVYNTLNKVYMALLMGAVMAIIMLGIMIFRMPNISVTTYILLIIFICISIILVVRIRDQSNIEQEEFAKAMIEHHDMALLMSQRILAKPYQSSAVYSLADNIYTTQSQEIALMRSWLKEGFPPSEAEDFTQRME